MRVFITNKLEERKKLEEKGFQCREEAGKDSVNFVFEVEEDVMIEEILKPVVASSPEKKADTDESKPDLPGKSKKKKKKK